MLRNATTSLSQFPFKVCLERIIDFYFLGTYKILKQNFGRHFTLLHGVLYRGDWELLTETAKQTSQKTSWQIEFSDTFK